MQMNDASDNNTMFRRADDQSPMAKALTDAATAITTILSRKQSTSGQGSVTVENSSSSAKLMHRKRSQLDKQLSELQNLKGCGVFTEYILLIKVDVVEAI